MSGGSGDGTSFKNVVPTHCFIPTVSALGFQYQTMGSYQNTSSLPDAYASLLGRNLTCSNETPFDAYYGPTRNTQHVVGQDPGTSAFLGRELAGNAETPVFATAPAATVCPNQNTTFALLASCARLPVTYTWTLSGNLAFANGQTTATGTSQVVYGTAIGTGQIRVVATQQGLAPSAPLIAEVSVASNGYVNLQALTGGEDVCIGSVVTVKAYAFSGAAVSNWYVSNGQLLGVSGDEATVQVSSSAGTTTVYADYLNNCPGTSGGATASASIYVVDNKNGFYCAARTGTPQVAVYPNPADAYVNIQSPFAAARPYRIELHNDRGGRVHGETARSSAVRVDTHALPNGLYHLTLRQGNQTLNYNLSIQH